MTATVSIGEFSRLTYLSVKTLRYYHEIDLLEPAAVDRGSGYRRYSTDQVAQAHLIRRLRERACERTINTACTAPAPTSASEEGTELDMPLPEIAAMLAAPDPATRDAALRVHLERMEAELLRTRNVVASLRALLLPAAALEVEYRSVPAFAALAITGVVARDALGDWCATAFPTLYETLGRAGVAPAGPSGGTYSSAFFEDEIGEVVAFVPIPAAGRDQLMETETVVVQQFPAQRFAIAVHSGAFADFDRTYGALGSHVAVHDSALAEPIREIYVVGPQDSADPTTYRTEVCWPIGRP